MSDRPKEFEIEYSVKGVSGRVTVIGRCGDTPIPVGTIFTILYRNKDRQYPHGLEVPAERAQEIQVRLEVRGATAYGTERDPLPGGTTGCLIFDERETELLPGGWILSTE